jgi:hypothetical protein
MSYMGKYIDDESVRKQINKHLENIAGIECSLGTDSTRKEFTTAKYRQNKELEKIKLLDEEFYDKINP